MVQQKTSLRCLWKHLNPNGIYAIEDLGTSYWPKFGGGKGKETTIEHLKNLVDNLNYASIDHARAEEDRKSCKNIGLMSIHFYPLICFLYHE